MQKLLAALGGVVFGFVLAHFVNQTPGGRRFFACVNKGVQEFQEAFAAGYNEAETE